MSEQKIEPHRVTKPIQLLAAWLVGLILTNGIFLGAAVAFPETAWERGALVIASIANVPVFLIALFLLQTRFRAELQEDSFYADYLSKKTAAHVRIDKDSTQDARLNSIERTMSLFASAKQISQIEAPPSEQTSGKLDWLNWTVGLNEHHPRFSELREAFRSAGIPVGDIFGTNQAPPKWIISLANHLPVENKIAILRAALPYGFDGIQFWDPQREAEENEDAYLGSYYDGGSAYARVTEELLKLVTKKVEAADLKHYYSKHKVWRKKQQAAA